MRELTAKAMGCLKLKTGVRENGVYWKVNAGETVFFCKSAQSWLSVDPLAHKYPSLSPYVYCANNPIGRVDPDGRLDGDFTLNGIIIGNDGKNDGKLYALKNEALTSKDLRATKKFIKENSGNTGAFESNDAAYKNRY